MLRITIINLLDNFIPVILRSTHSLSHEQLVRTRAMLAMLGFSIVVPVLLLVVYILLQILTQNDFSRDIYILLVLEIVLISEHIYFQSYGNLRITAGVYSLLFLFIVIAFTLLSGGITSPLISLLVAAPMVAYMTMGLRAGLLHIAVVLLIVFAFLLMHVLRIDFPNISLHANYPYTRALACGVTLLILAMFLLVFEDLVCDRE